MKQSAIEVGKTYRNRLKGKTERTVIRIGQDIKTFWYGDFPAQEPGVEYSQNWKVGRCCLSVFAAWAGSEVA